MCRSFIIDVESKLTEYTSWHKAYFSSQHYDKISSKNDNERWVHAMYEVDDSPSSYQYFDAPQFIKHAFNLHYTFPKKKIILLYFYWEPQNTGEYEIFECHRKEIEQFSRLVSGARVRFESMSYPDLRDSGKTSRISLTGWRVTCATCAIATRFLCKSGVRGLKMVLSNGTPKGAAQWTPSSDGTHSDTIIGTRAEVYSTCRPDLS